MFLNTKFNKVDHLAIAVLDLDQGIDFYVNKMGYKLDVIRDTQGKYSGMRSAVLFSGQFSVVLVKSLSEGSQIDKYISRYGTGIQHVAFAVDDIHATYQELANRGVEFSTSIIEAPGLRQLFTKRDPNTGMMHEFIERTEQSSFDVRNINQLFEQLESSNEF